MVEINSVLRLAKREPTSEMLVGSLVSQAYQSRLRLSSS